MATKTKQPCWPKRFGRMKTVELDIRLPKTEERSLSQDAEWCEVELDGRRKRIRFHDYHEVYDIPGLYERIFYETLECNSPTRIADLLDDVLDDEDDAMDDLRVLDVGAGNGMVGDELAERDVPHMVGIDIIPEAKKAALRDRPGLYDDYLVADLTDLSEKDEEYLRKHKLNCLTTVAALGFGDIPAKAFIKALDLTETPAWLAFNINEMFLREQDDSGFSQLVRQLNREGVIRMHAYRRYCHRLSIDGKKLYYVAAIAKKLRDIPDHMIEEYA